MEQEELEYFEMVQALLDREIARLNGSQKETRREIRERTREFLENDPYGAVYGGRDPDRFDSEALSLRSANEHAFSAAAEMRRQAEIYARMKQTPYFGRVDFVYDGEDEPERFYIGLAQLSDPDGLDIAVYDWRAPVSSLFYTGETGRASYDAPAGKIFGEILRIRQYSFENGELRAYRDADLHIDDELLRETLSGASAEKMKPIVATIQKEQNRAIRFDLKRDLAVLGPAGCGKTSIGTHRLAWLLYRAQTGGVTPRLLMFTGNEAFREYISGVLPELGEREADTCSFGELLEDALRGYEIEPALSQTERLLTGDPVRAENVEKMYSAGFLRSIDEAVAALTPQFPDVRLLGHTLVDAAALTERFCALSRALPLLERLNVLAEWARDAAAGALALRKDALIAEAMDSDPDKNGPSELFGILSAKAKDAAERAVFDAASTEPVPVWLRLVRAYFGDGPFAAAAARRAESRSLYYEDAVAVLYIAALLGTAGERAQPSHILIDEAQDLAPIQHRTLRRLFPKTVFTVLADVNQGVLPAVNVRTGEKLAEIYGADTVRIGKSYRATKPLAEFSKRFLPAGSQDYEVFDRQGEPPFVYHTENAAETAARIAEHEPGECRSVCAILRTVAETRAFYEALRAYLPDCSAVLDENGSIGARVVCMPAALTKGLEFDSVILPDADRLESDRATAYLMTTRALHRLHLLYR